MKSAYLLSVLVALVVAFLVTFLPRCEGANSYPIAMSPRPLTFGTVALGTAVKTENVANMGRNTVILTAARVSGTGFVLQYHPPFPYTLAGGTSVALGVKLSAKSAGDFTGTLMIRYRYRNDGIWYENSRMVHIYGATTSSRLLMLSPRAENFGAVQISSMKTLLETVRNSGTEALTISQIATNGAGYAFSGINPPLTLSPGQSASFKISFKPQANGLSLGKLTMASNASDSLVVVSLSGTGRVPGQLAVSPAHISFGQVVDGNHKSQTATITAVSGPVTLSGANVTGSEFSFRGLSFPFTLNAGQSASYNLLFSPSSSGAASGDVAWFSTASNSPVSQSLSGTGIAPTQHVVTLHWNASASANLAGYNLYRSTQSGGPYTRINSVLDVATTDTDYAVSAGQTYYYVVTAVNSSSQESGYSNQAQAVIPYP